MHGIVEPGCYRRVFSWRIFVWWYHTWNLTRLTFSGFFFRFLSSRFCGWNNFIGQPPHSPMYIPRLWMCTKGAPSPKQYFWPLFGWGNLTSCTCKATATCHTRKKSSHCHLFAKGQVRPARQWQFCFRAQAQKLRICTQLLPTSGKNQHTNPNVSFEMHIRSPSKGVLWMYC